LHYIYLHLFAKVLEKEKFLQLVTNIDSLTQDETKELVLLQTEFPYSQVVHNLVARGAQLNDLPDRQNRLNSAAVYSTDRSVLKAIVTAARGVRIEPVKITTAPKEVKEVPKAVVEQAKQPKAEITAKKSADPSQSVAKFEPSNLSGDDLLNELFRDLDQLKKLKHDFEVASESFDKKIPLEKPDKLDVKVEQERRPVAGNEGIMAEIKSKKKIKPSDPKQKEQLEIIENFIKTKPSIGKNKPVSGASDNTDLSENSSVFSDNIVSETLVEILIKQGKKDKAIEVLKKLIWKFPQKKAYFAAQIEELTS